MIGRVTSIALFLACAALLPAQGNAPRKSPHDTVKTTLGGQEVSISYGRPYLRGRKAVGGSLVPYGQVWRLGADEATKLTTAAPLMIGDLHVPPGSYALFAMANADGWTLIVSKKADQWGAFSYDKADDLGRVPMQVSKTDGPVEQFTMHFDKTGDREAQLVMEWENTRVSVPVKAH